jgi:parvulin-like peptidyl-prolyl isomerase
MAARAAGITVPPRELEAAWEASQEGYRTEDFKGALYAQMQTPQRMKAQLEERLLTEKFLADKTRVLPRITDAEVRQFYEVNRGRYRVQEQVRARQVVLRTPEEARIIADRLARGEDFAKLAREFSVAPEKERGGDLGFFQKGVMPEVFDKVCFALEPGQVSDVITSEYGQHIFQVTERRPESAQPLEAVDAEIREQLRRAQVELAENRLLVDLRNKAVVVKDGEALQWAADLLAVWDGGGRG